LGEIAEPSAPVREGYVPHDCKRADFSSGPLKSQDILYKPALLPSTNLEMIHKYMVGSPSRFPSENGLSQFCQFVRKVRKIFPPQFLKMCSALQIIPLPGREVDLLGQNNGVIPPRKGGGQPFICADPSERLFLAQAEYGDWTRVYSRRFGVPKPPSRLGHDPLIEP
jgi:hypothetical protein